jgi:hypothetical protein
VDSRPNRTPHHLCIAIIGAGVPFGDMRPLLRVGEKLQLDETLGEVARSAREVAVVVRLRELSAEIAQDPLRRRGVAGEQLDRAEDRRAVGVECRAQAELLEVVAATAISSRARPKSPRCAARPPRNARRYATPARSSVWSRKSCSHRRVASSTGVGPQYRAAAISPTHDDVGQPAAL